MRLSPINSLVPNSWHHSAERTAELGASHRSSFAFLPKMILVDSQVLMRLRVVRNIRLVIFAILGVRESECGVKDL